MLTSTGIWVVNFLLIKPKLAGYFEIGKDVKSMNGIPGVVLHKMLTTYGVYQNQIILLHTLFTILVVI